jgi:hypothetical protein
MSRVGHFLFRKPQTREARLGILRNLKTRRNVKRKTSDAKHGLPPQKKRPNVAALLSNFMQKEKFISSVGFRFCFIVSLVAALCCEWRRFRFDGGFLCHDCCLGMVWQWMKEKAGLAQKGLVVLV